MSGGYAYQLGRYSNSGNYNNGAYIGASLVNLPLLYNFTPEIKNAAIKLEQAELKYTSAQNRAVKDVSAAYERFLTAADNLNHYEKNIVAGSKALIETIMILAGASMCVGNLLGGKLSDKFSPAKVARLTQLTACIALILIFFFSHNPIVSVILMCVCTGCLFGVSAPQQVLLIENAKGGEMLGASFSQISFNLGNAIGAFVGGIPISHGLAYNYTAIPGAVFAFMGFGMLYYFHKRYN